MLKIPILISDDKYYELNLPNPPVEEEEQIFIYLNAMMIMGFGPWVEDGEVDYEFTQLMITNGASFKLPMSVMESLEYLGFIQTQEDGVPLDSD